MATNNGYIGLDTRYTMDTTTTITHIDGRPLDLSMLLLYKEIMATDLTKIPIAGRIDIVETLTMELSITNVDLGSGPLRSTLAAAYRTCAKTYGYLSEDRLSSVVASTVDVFGKQMTLYILAACIVKLYETAGVRYYITQEIPNVKTDPMSRCYDILYHLRNRCHHNGSSYGHFCTLLGKLHTNISMRSHKEESLLVPWDDKWAPHERLLWVMGHYMAMNHLNATRDAILLCSCLTLVVRDRDAVTSGDTSPGKPMSAEVAPVVPSGTTTLTKDVPSSPTISPPKATTVRIGSRPFDLTTVPVYKELMDLWSRTDHIALITTLETLVAGLGYAQVNMRDAEMTETGLNRMLLERCANHWGHLRLVNAITDMVLLHGKTMSLYILIACLVHLHTLDGVRHYTNAAETKHDNVAQYYGILYHYIDQFAHKGAGPEAIHDRLRTLNKTLSWASGSALLMPWRDHGQAEGELIVFIGCYLAMNHLSSAQETVRLCMDPNTITWYKASPSAAPVMVSRDIKGITGASPIAEDRYTVSWSMADVAGGKQSSEAIMETRARQHVSGGHVPDGALAHVVSELSKKVAQLEEEMEMLTNKGRWMQW